MNAFILFICHLLDVMLNPLILLAGFLELILCIWLCSRLRERHRRIRAMNEAVMNTGHSMRVGEGAVSTAVGGHIEKSWGDLKTFLKEYENVQSWYAAFSMLIQLFPLLGILGTVAGLFIALNSGSDIYEGVGFALSSTVLGIILAVVFKVLELILESVFVLRIEEEVSRYEKEYNIFRDDARFDRDESAGSVRDADGASASGEA